MHLWTYLFIFFESNTLLLIVLHFLHCSAPIQFLISTFSQIHLWWNPSRSYQRDLKHVSAAHTSEQKINENAPLFFFQTHATREKLWTTSVRVCDVAFWLLNGTDLFFDVGPDWDEFWAPSKAYENSLQNKTYEHLMAIWTGMLFVDFVACANWFIVHLHMDFTHTDKKNCYIVSQWVRINYY